MHQCPICKATRSKSGKPFTKTSLANHMRDSHETSDQVNLHLGDIGMPDDPQLNDTLLRWKAPYRNPNDR